MRFLGKIEEKRLHWRITGRTSDIRLITSGAPEMPALWGGVRLCDIARGAGVGCKVFSPLCPVANASPALVVSPPHCVPLPFVRILSARFSVLFRAGRGGPKFRALALEQRGPQMGNGAGNNARGPCLYFPGPLPVFPGAPPYIWCPALSLFL